MVGFVVKINPSGPSQEELWRRREKKTKEAVRDGHNIYEQSPLPLPPPQSRRRRGLELASETKTGGVKGRRPGLRRMLQRPSLFRWR